MGFWDKLGEAMGNNIRQTSEDYANTKKIIAENDFSDKQLIDRFKDTSKVGKKAAYGEELKKRGYGKKDS